MRNDKSVGTLSALIWLWRFHSWANPRLLDAANALSADDLRREGAVPGALGDGSLFELLAHLAGAETIWLRRWNGEGQAVLPFGADYKDLPSLEGSWRQTSKERESFLESLRPDDLQREVHYRSVTRGTMETYSLWHTLLHAANHTTHHRAEACTVLTALGQSPESVDLIDFMRARV